MTEIEAAQHRAMSAMEMFHRNFSKVPEDRLHWQAAREQEERAVKSREEVEAAFRVGTERVLAAMDALKPEDMDLILESGQGWQMPMRFLVDLPVTHANLHCGQIDFLQTCWGDQEVYVG